VKIPVVLSLTTGINNAKGVILLLFHATGDVNCVCAITDTLIEQVLLLLPFFTSTKVRSCLSTFPCTCSREDIMVSYPPQKNSSWRVNDEMNQG